MRATAVLAALCLAASGAAAADDLKGEALRRTVSGKRVYLATPLGGEFPLNYRADGVVDGSGAAVGLGRWMQTTDSGSWWVDGDRLCQKWRSWYKGKPFCFTIRATGPGTIAWTRDDGFAGTARIVD